MFGRNGLFRVCADRMTNQSRNREQVVQEVASQLSRASKYETMVQLKKSPTRLSVGCHNMDDFEVVS